MLCRLHEYIHPTTNDEEQSVVGCRLYARQSLFTASLTVWCVCEYTLKFRKCLQVERRRRRLKQTLARRSTRCWCELRARTGSAQRLLLDATPQHSNEQPRHQQKIELCRVSCCCACWFENGWCVYQACAGGALSQRLWWGALRYAQCGAQVCVFSSVGMPKQRRTWTRTNTLRQAGKLV